MYIFIVVISVGMANYFNSLSNENTKKMNEADDSTFILRTTTTKILKGAEERL